MGQEQQGQGSLLERLKAMQAKAQEAPPAEVLQAEKPVMPTEPAPDAQAPPPMNPPEGAAGCKRHTFKGLPECVRCGAPNPVALVQPTAESLTTAPTAESLTTPTATTAMAATVPTAVVDGPVPRTPLVVYVDCAPVKGANGCVTLAELLAPMRAMVARDAGVAHWGLVDFAKGGPALEALMERWLDARIWSGTVLVDSWTKEAQAVMGALVAHADLVVRGIR